MCYKSIPSSFSPASACCLPCPPRIVWYQNHKIMDLTGSTIKNVTIVVALLLLRFVLLHKIMTLSRRHCPSCCPCPPPPPAFLILSVVLLPLLPVIFLLLLLIFLLNPLPCCHLSIALFPNVILSKLSMPSSPPYSSLLFLFSSLLSLS